MGVAQSRGGPVGDQHNQHKQQARQAAEQQYEREERHLIRVWERAEAAHPLLASLRGAETNLEDVDLGALDAPSAPPQMAGMLREVMPKAVAIRRVYSRLSLGPDAPGYLNPLSLPPVVAITKAAMFVPEGSIRAGKINDLVEDAQDKTVSQYIAEGLLALIVLATVIPSAGSSLAVGIGLTSAALSVTSAVEDWEHYKKQKLLVNTSLDRARALSNEEPSLTPVALDLIFLGFDGVALSSAFHDVVSLRNLVREGQAAKNAREVKTIIGRLDKLGEARGTDRLGESMAERVGTIEREATSPPRAQPDPPAAKPTKPEPTAAKPAPSAADRPPAHPSHEAVKDPAHAAPESESPSPTTTTHDPEPAGAAGSGRDAKIVRQQGVVDKRRIAWGDAQKRVAETSDQLTAAQGAVGPARERATAARAKLTAADKRAASAQEGMNKARWSAERTAAQQRRDEAREAGKQAKAELRTAQKDLDDARAAVKRLEKKLTQHEDAVSRTTTELERAETELQKIASRTGEEVPRLDPNVPLDQRQAQFRVDRQRPRYSKSGSGLLTGRGRPRRNRRRRHGQDLPGSPLG